MGEAKRRKQALGDRYGQTPPSLINGSAQLNEHIQKFSSAYFEKLKAVGKGLFTAHFTDNEAPSDTQSALNQDTVSPDMQAWLKDYLEPYRPQDREKLVDAFLAPLYSSLYADNEDELEQDPEETVSQIMLDLTICIISFKSLKAFLSEQAQDKYGGVLNTIYSEMTNEIEADPDIKDEDKSEELSRLSKLFQGCFNDESLPV